MDTFFNALGWIGAAAFSLCAVPQAVEAYINKVCHINRAFLGLWLTGEVFTLAYSLYIGATPLIINYVVNGVCLIFITYYNKPISRP